MMSQAERDALCLNQSGLTAEQLRLRHNGREHEYIMRPQDMFVPILGLTFIAIGGSISGGSAWGWLLFEPFFILLMVFLSHRETEGYHRRQEEWDARLNPREYDAMIKNIDENKYVYIHDILTEYNMLKERIDNLKKWYSYEWDEKYENFVYYPFWEQMQEVKSGRIYKDNWVAKTPNWDQRIHVEKIKYLGMSDLEIYWDKFHAEETKSN